MSVYSLCTCLDADVCVHVCMCTHVHLSVYCISPKSLIQQGMEVIFPKEKKINKSLPTALSNVFPIPSSWQLMFQLHEPPVLHGYMVLDKVWLPRGLLS